MAGHLNLRQRLLTFVILIVVTTAALKLHPPSLAIAILAVSIDEYHRCVRQLPYAILPIKIADSTKQSIEESTEQSKDASDEASKAHSNGHSIKHSAKQAIKQTIERSTHHLLNQSTLPAFTIQSRIFHVISAVVICCSSLWGAVPLTFITLAVNSGLLIHSMLVNRSTDRPLTTAALVMIGDMFGHVYLSFLWSHALLIYIEQSKWQSINHAVDWHGLTMVIYTIFTVVIGENGALFFGRALGRHRLAPAISPNKSVEGAVAQVVTSTLASLLFAHYFIDYFTVIDAACLGFAVGVLGTVGDLFESFLKRAVNVKDVGSLLPGTGGFLDRVDGLTVCFPLVYYYLKIRFEEWQT